MLPVLIQVFAGFSKMDGRVDEADIDSTLGFLRYDYPETVYSELRELYAKALHEWQNLDEIAEIVKNTAGLKYTTELAEKEINQAIRCLSHLPDSEYKDAMLSLAKFTANRSF